MRPQGPGTHICQRSGLEFEISESDIEFYQKMDVPLPRFCPEERALQRMAFANQRNLFVRKCDGSGARIISNYPQGSTPPIYELDYWYSDKWDMFASGRDYDFTRPFFDQIADLLEVAPRINLQRSPMDENCDYTNYAGKNRDCYLIFDSDKNRDCLYSYSINSCEDIIDCFRAENCELCYECVDCTDCYSSLYLQDCYNCSNSYFLKSCIGCRDCFGCVNLKNKQYYYLNEPCTKEDYYQKLEKLKLNSASALFSFPEKFAAFTTQFPQRYMQGVQNENVIGDYLTNCKDAFYCYDSRKLWDCKYVTQAFDDAKDCMDCTEIGDGVELFYETCYAGYNGNFVRFSSHCLGQTADLTYCIYTPYCNNCFGCVGLHHTSHAILNKKYSEEEYHQLIPKIVSHMKETGEWGEFFRPDLALSPYNLSHAYDYFPLSKEEALSRGYRWAEREERDYQKFQVEVPDNIDDTDESICKEILSCKETGKNYKIQKSEFNFYKKRKTIGSNFNKLCYGRCR